MKNIHVLPNKENVQYIYITDNSEIKEGDYVTNGSYVTKAVNDWWVKFYIGNPKVKADYFKVVLTDNPDLIADGVQAIEDEFLEWFVKNPSCEEVETAKGKMKLNDDGQEYGFPDMSLYKIIIPKEEPKISDEAKERAKNYMALKGALEVKEGALEKVAKKYRLSTVNKMSIEEVAFLKGAEFQAKKMYSKEEVKGMLFKVGIAMRYKGINYHAYFNHKNVSEEVNKVLEQHKKK